MLRSRTAGLLVLASGIASCGGESAPGVDAANEQAFVETLGTDTIAMESFARTDSSVEGRIVSRNPSTVLAHYRADLDSEGLIERFEASWRPGEALDGPATSSVVVTSNGSEATIIRTRPEGTDTVSVELEAPLVPNVGRLPLAVGMADYATRRAVAEGSSAFDIAMLSPLPARVASNMIEQRSGNAYTLSYFGSPQVITVDEAGAVQSVSGSETTNRVEIAPAGQVDVLAMARAFAERDASGTGLGVPSPTDTVLATVGGADIVVVYSRPAMRGRDIWGGLVPYGGVWRTGANAATHFSTSQAIRLGELDLPAGDYTLWSSFAEDGGTLIVNSQTGQWGTAYDGEQDFGRTELTESATDQPVERFTIEVAESEGAAELRLVWADRSYAAPILVP